MKDTWEIVRWSVQLDQHDGTPLGRQNLAWLRGIPCERNGNYHSLVWEEQLLTTNKIKNQEPTIKCVIAYSQSVWIHYLWLHPSQPSLALRPTWSFLLNDATNSIAVNVFRKTEHTMNILKISTSLITTHLSSMSSCWLNCGNPHSCLG